MATTTYGTPYVQNTDLVSGWPGSSLLVAQRVDAVSYAGNGINAQTGTTYTLVLTDAGKNVTLSNASAVTVTVPASGSVNYATGTQIRFVNLGAGTVTIAAAGGVTLSGSPLTLSQYTDGTITKLATDTWVFTSAPVPTSSGLVQITPTSIANSGGSASASGGAVTFTGVTSVSLNNVFTSTYDNYLVLPYLSSIAAGVQLRMRYRSAGADAAGATDYQWGNTYMDTGATGWDSGSTGDSAITIAGGSAGARLNGAVWVFLPAIAIATAGLQDSTGYSTIPIRRSGPNWHKLANAYDGFTFLGSSGSISGIVRVYGLKN